MEVIETSCERKRAIFLDRDGVINKYRQDYVKAWDEFVLLPGVLEALGLLADSEFLVIVITNQSAINRGLVSNTIVEDINWRMVNQVKKSGARIDGVYYCPHIPSEGCDCRKPLPGLLLRAAREMHIDLERSYCVGDKMTDVAAGKAAGCRSILVLAGEGDKQDEGTLNAFVIARDLRHAVDIILNDADSVLATI